MKIILIGEDLKVLFKLLSKKKYSQILEYEIEILKFKELKGGKR
jgi:hypothetical protein